MRERTASRRRDAATVASMIGACWMGLTCGAGRTQPSPDPRSDVQPVDGTANPPARHGEAPPPLSTDVPPESSSPVPRGTPERETSTSSGGPSP